MHPLRDGPGDQLRLVVPALAMAVAMQRNRYDYVNALLSPLPENHFRQSIAEPIRERNHLLVLQQEDYFRKSTIVNRKAARLIERIEVGSAQPAKRLVQRRIHWSRRRHIPAGRSGHRPAAAGAYGINDPLKLVETRSAHRDSADGG